MHSFILLRDRLNTFDMQSVNSSGFCFQDDEESMGFHMSNAVKGASAQGPGFSLKF